MIVFIVLCVAAAACGTDNARKLKRGGALRAYGVAMDVRAAGRDPGAYGRRVARRAVFRSLRRW
ncbi:MAG: hypothetical protein OXJ62_14950 [Spirochaetaceae bacterium]|nr:hypothetical protein [Spirochaetaceae bacterium]